MTGTRVRNQSDSPSSSLAGSLAALGERATRPSEAVTEVGARRQARLLASLLLAIIPVGVVSAVEQLVTRPGFAGRFAVIACALAALLLAYLLSRTRYLMWASLIASATPIVASAAIALIAPDDPGWFAFITLGVVLGSIFLHFPQAVAVAALAFVATAALVRFDPEIRASEANSVAIAFVAIMSALTLLAARHRTGVERARRADLLAREHLHRSVLQTTFGGIALHDDGVLQEVNVAFAETFRRDAGELAG